MPLNRPALALGPGPVACRTRAAGWPSCCTEIGRPELVECAELGVSELVTNALLHGEPPITVRVRGTAEHPRVEVRDGSRRAADPARPAESEPEPTTCC